MKNILIVCERFAPENTVGATRMTKIAKYLKRTGKYNITVLTREKNVERPDEFLLKDTLYVDKFLYATEGKIGKWVKEKYATRSSSKKYVDNKRNESEILTNNQKARQVIGIKKSIISLVSVLITVVIAHSYKKNALKKIEHCGKKFDVVISSHGPESSHYIGQGYKRFNRKALWIADFRDQLFQGEATFGLLRWWSRTYTARICKKADYLTAVSKGCLDNIYAPINAKTKVITNGFDPDDITGITDKYKKEGVFTLAYIGSFLIGRRDISPVLKCVNDLILEEKIKKNKVRIVYAGEDKAEFIVQIEKYGLKEICTYFDKIPRVDALAWEKSSDLLLLAAWNTKGYTGSLPAKFYEYLNINKNIVCCISGTAGESELKELIQKANAGFCYEEVTHLKDYNNLKQFVYEKYKEFYDKGCLKTQYNMQFVRQFQHNFLANEFEKLFKEI